jgi:hypothetical protein
MGAAHVSAAAEPHDQKQSACKQRKREKGVE